MRRRVVYFSFLTLRCYVQLSEYHDLIHYVYLRPDENVERTFLMLGLRRPLRFQQMKKEKKIFQVGTTSV